MGFVLGKSSSIHITTQFFIVTSVSCLNEILLLRYIHHPLVCFCRVAQGYILLWLLHSSLQMSSARILCLQLLRFFSAIYFTSVSFGIKDLALIWIKCRPFVLKQAILSLQFTWLYSLLYSTDSPCTRCGKKFEMHLLHDSSSEQ